MKDGIWAKRILSCLVCAALVVVCIFCLKKTKPGNVLTTGEINVVKDENFGGIYIGLTIEEFNELGFSFGDSVDISFDNGITLEQVPYYSGYYSPVGDLLLCGYPGYPHAVIARNYGDSTWDEFAITPETHVTVTLHERAAYIGRQEALNLRYSNDENDFASEEIFANYRELKGGKLRQGCIYRSASPCDDQYHRAACADHLAKDSGIGFVINLSDSYEEYQSLREESDADSDYYDELCQENKILFLNLNANYRSDEFAQILSKALYDMAMQDGSCLIHCVEGKDRAGFVCALILSLADASADEIETDYLITFANYYGITKEKKPKQYEAVKENVDDFLYFLCGAEKGSSLEAADLKKGAIDYLKRGGLTDEQIKAVETYLSQE